MLRAIDLCCGAGGWACAARGLPIRVVYAVDLWEPATRTYKLNHPETTVEVGDLRNETLRERIVKEFRGVDLLLGGIPCEWLSVYRNFTGKNSVKEKELAEQRATLDSVLGIVEAISPKYWCLEDVKGLVKELPPLTPWTEIDAAQYSAQRRKRVYVGNFPAPRRSRHHGKLADVVRPGPYRIGPRAFDRSPTQNKSFSKETSYGAELDRKMPTVCSMCSRRDAEMQIVDPRLPSGKRQMEWQEAAAGQGFPLDYVFYGNPGAVWKMVGRAIQIDTGRAILSSIVEDAKKKGAVCAS